MSRYCWRSRRDERGAILILATVGVVIAVIASALAVDLGRIAQERRRDQRVADLAAVDAIRDLANAQALAEASANRNSFPTGPGYSVAAIEGKKVSGTCEAQPGSGHVCVTVTSPLNNNFLPGRQTIVARAMAASKKQAGFSIGSSLATANLDTELPILNRVFERLLDPGDDSPGSLNLVSYQGLATANVKIRQLQTQLGFGTVNELLAANLTLGQLLNATGTILNNEGVAAAAQVNQLAAVVTSTATVKLGDFISVAQGAEGTAAETGINVLQLITAAAELANKDTFIDAGSIITLPVPGVGTISTKLGLKVIEGPQIYIGPPDPPNPGPHATTSQVELTLTPHINAEIGVGLLGLTLLKITGDLPVKHMAAGATGTLTDVRCTGSQGITVGVASQPIATSVATSLDVRFLGLPIARVDVGPATTNSASGGGSPSFAWDSEFSPPFPGKSTPSVPVGLNLSAGQVTVTVLGVLPPGVTVPQILNAILNPILNPVLAAVGNRIVSPALSALGISIGPVDVQALRDAFNPSECGQPALVG